MPDSFFLGVLAGVILGVAMAGVAMFLFVAVPDLRTTAAAREARNAAIRAGCDDAPEGGR